MPAAKRPVAVLWNSAAGWSAGDQDARQVCEILSGNANVDFLAFNKGEDLAQKSRDFIQSGAEILVAAGGDGTVNAVASAVVNTPSALGVIPAGTLNHFARDLAIPLDPEGAATSIRDGREIQVDVGCVNDRVFINNSVLGVFPVYSAARQAYERQGLSSTRLGRFFSFCRAILHVFWRLPKLRLRFQLPDGETHAVETPFVLIANNEHEIENWNIGHRKSIDKGCLWVYVMRRCSRWAVLRFLAAFLMRRFSRHEAFNIYHAKEVEVDASPKLIRVGVDGEIVRLETPLHYRSMPKSLRVIAPSAYHPEETA